MNIGFVICSRTDSRRLPNKPFIEIKGKYLICHLLDRLKACGIPAYIAVPSHEREYYAAKLGRYLDNRQVFLIGGPKDDPLERMLKTANLHNLDHVIRVTHDKIFVNYSQIDTFVDHYFKNSLDYLYSTNFIPGMSFEIISRNALKEAAEEFKDVEHVSYAVEEVTRKKQDLYHFPFNRSWLNRKKPNSGLRLLLDYDDDVDAITTIMTELGSECHILDIVEDLNGSTQINSKPDVSVYTCTYNDFEHLPRAAASVAGQSYSNLEYLILDDGSTAKEVEVTICDAKRSFKRIRHLLNLQNKGLASSSNSCVEHANGRYVMRLDADDYFVNEKVIERMVHHMESSGCDILFPAHYVNGEVVNGSVNHHVGGAMFKKRALDYLRFTDGLKHYDGLDLYKRAVERGLKIDYLAEPTFHYRQRHDSLSKNKSLARQRVAEKLAQGITGSALL